MKDFYYWKNELYKSFKTICSFRQLRRPGELSFVNLEKAVMIAAYIVRKLKDAGKIPDFFLSENVSVIEFICKGNIIDILNSHRIDKHYSFKSDRPYSNSWEYFINQIIHSFTYILSYDDNNNFDGILINSDRTKDTSLYLLSIKDFLLLLLKISEGSITDSRYTRDFENGKNGELIPGPMKMINAVYGYPIQLDFNRIVEDSMDGNIYGRDKDFV